MAKKKAVTVNKAQAIRDYLQMHPEATATVVIPALAKEGITVSSALVSNTRSRLKKAGATNKSAKKKTAGKPASLTTTEESSRVGDGRLSAEDLFEAKKLADQLGGIDEARDALDVLERLR